jgi:hypothetical protein
LISVEFWQQLVLQEEAARKSGQQSAPVQQKTAPLKAKNHDQPPFVLDEKASVRFRRVLDYDSNQNIIYCGESHTGTSQEAATWRIRNLIYDANNNIIDVRWAEGNQKFDKIWNLRVTYTYS